MDRLPLLSLALGSLLSLGGSTVSFATVGQEPKIEGKYKIVSGEKFGQPEPQENIDRTTADITGERIIVYDRDQKETYSASYTLDKTETPWRIVMVSKRAPEQDVEAKGLIEKKGDTLRLIYALPGGETPTDFKTGPGQLMFTMTSTTPKGNQ